MRTLKPTAEIMSTVGGFFGHRGRVCPVTKRCLVVGTSEHLPRAAAFFDETAGGLICLDLATDPFATLSERHAAVVFLVRLAQTAATLENRHLSAVAQTKSLMKLLRRLGWGSIGMMMGSRRSEIPMERKRGKQKSEDGGSERDERDGGDSPVDLPSGGHGGAGKGPSVGKGANGRPPRKPSNRRPEARKAPVRA